MLLIPCIKIIAKTFAIQEERVTLHQILLTIKIKNDEHKDRILKPV
jgi:hypothetical protein